MISGVLSLGYMKVFCLWIITISDLSFEYSSIA